MKSKVMLLGIFLIFFAILLSNISAELNSTQINMGYTCLQNKTQNCSTSLDENIFTLLAINTCKAEVMNASSNDECWPKGACKIKQTAQALLALKESGADTSKPEKWLLAHNQTTDNLEWFLQIESPDETVCSISYSGKSYSIKIYENKTINANAGSCLSLAYGNYWLQIAQSCQKNEYEISCNKNFQTSTLFKEKSLETIYVTGEEAKSASPGGTTKEKVNSLCFAESKSCSYEGTLWASLVLNSLDYDVTPYIPYLITLSGSNPRTLPEAFLYVLQGDNYLNDLLLRQKSNQYWEASGNRYYDTALALLALQQDEIPAKTNALDWLGETQGKNGCWQNNIRDTAFLLYSISGTFSSNGGGGGNSKPDCETAGYSCYSDITCQASGGNTLDAYSCLSGLLSCCDKEREFQTCAEQGGEICTGSKKCFGGTVAQSSDALFSECCVNGGTCIIGGGGDGSVCTPSCTGNDDCISGVCVPSGDKGNSCELNDGVCRSFECNTGETADSSFDCDYSSEVCCIDTSKSGGSSSYLWIWIFAILIILLVLAIIFRDKLRRFWLYVKTKFKPKSGPSEQNGRGFSGGPMHLGIPMRGMIPRRIIPSSGQHHGPVAPVRRHTGELDDVLKKLKDMSK